MTRFKPRIQRSVSYFFCSSIRPDSVRSFSSLKKETTEDIAAVKIMATTMAVVIVSTATMVVAIMMVAELTDTDTIAVMAAGVVGDTTVAGVVVVDMTVVDSTVAGVVAVEVIDLVYSHELRVAATGNMSC